MFFKGVIKVFDFRDNILASETYDTKKDAMALFNKWKEAYSSQVSYFILCPLVEMDLVVSVPVRWKNISEPVLIDEVKKLPIVRPKAEYSNKSPFGIADKIKRPKTVIESYVKKRIFRRDDGDYDSHFPANKF